MEDRIRRVYIAGPMTGRSERNFPAFDLAAQRFRDAGWTVANPTENFDGCTDLPRAVYMRADMILLARCDAIAMLPGWQESRGALLEYLNARELDLTVLDAETMEPLAEAPPARVMLDTLKPAPTQTEDVTVDVTADVAGDPIPGIHDSGQREHFPSGMVRDASEGKPRLSLLSPFFIERIGQWSTLGAKKYSPRNWEKGSPFSRVLDSLERHVMKWKQGQRDEDHLAAIAWNAMAIIHYEAMIERGVLPAELDDMPRYAQGVA